MRLKSIGYELYDLKIPESWPMLSTAQTKYYITVLVLFSKSVSFMQRLLRHNIYISYNTNLSYL